MNRSASPYRKKRVRITFCKQSIKYKALLLYAWLSMMWILLPPPVVSIMNHFAALLITGAATNFLLLICGSFFAACEGNTGAFSAADKITCPHPKTCDCQRDRRNATVTAGSRTAIRYSYSKNAILQRAPIYVMGYDHNSLHRKSALLNFLVK